jgi:hypothetical protein
MELTNLIAINGYKSSGKDTVGSIIQYLIWKNKVELGYLPLANYTLDNFKTSGDNLSGWKIKKFANKLKDIVCILLSCTREQLEDHDFKEKELGKEWWLYTDGITSVPYIGGNKKILDNYNTRILKLTPRLILQQLGTEGMRDAVHPNIHVNGLFADLEREKLYEKLEQKESFIYPNIIITDMRFDNEYQAVKSRNGITIRVNKNLDNKDFHQSEIELDNHTFDYVIDNNGTIEDLIKQVREILFKEHII